MITSSADSTPTSRNLKIEEDGDPWFGNTKPKIRLRGNWLARAGFKHGHRVEVKCLAPGILELRAGNAVVADINYPPTSPQNSTPPEQ